MAACSMLDSNRSRDHGFSREDSMSSMLENFQKTEPAIRGDGSTSCPANFVDVHCRSQFVGANICCKNDDWLFQMPPTSQRGMLTLDDHDGSVELHIWVFPADLRGFVAAQLVKPFPRHPRPI
jgi:hypothetical protein